MATTYKLVQRRDMHKGATEGDKLYYAQAKSTGTSDMERLCSMIQGERSCVIQRRRESGAGLAYLRDEAGDVGRQDRAAG